MRRFFAVFVVITVPVFCFAQDFGFGFEDESPGSASILPVSLKIAGEIKAGQTFFFDDFKKGEMYERFQDLDFFSARINFSVTGKSADTFIGINLSYRNFADLADLRPGHTPRMLDEAWVRGYFGPVNLQAGFMKLTWGRMHSYGPLDVVNPFDYTDLSKLPEPKKIKIARPMIHAAWSMGSFTKLEAVFVPWLQGYKYATSGRWTPVQINSLVSQLPALAGGLEYAMSAMSIPEPYFSAFKNDLDNWRTNFTVEDHYRDYDLSMRYAQAGMRFTTTVASSDLGFQYYFGRPSRPRVRIGINEYLSGLSTLSPDPAKIVDIDYNYFHQIGADFARVVAGFNLRAEAGVNLTNDLDGKDGAVENPAIIWGLGFDRDLFAGINLNLQGTGKVRLFHSRISDNPLYDCEAGSKTSFSRITGIVARKFFREELELKVRCLWGIEDRDFLIMPAFVWSRNDVMLELSAGFFGGDKKGELGQYRDNSFFRAIVVYKF